MNVGSQVNAQSNDRPLQATCRLIPSASKRSYNATMMRNVKPPPELPQPAARAFALPTTLVSKNTVVQAAHVTNVPPKIPVRRGSPGVSILGNGVYTHR